MRTPLILLLLIPLLVIALKIVSQSERDSPTGVSETVDITPTNMAAEAETQQHDDMSPPDLTDFLVMPKDEHTMLMKLRSYRTQPLEGKNDLAKSSILSDDENEFCNSLSKHAQIRDWIGVVEGVSSSQDVIVNLIDQKSFSGWQGANIKIDLLFNVKGADEKFLESIKENDRVMFSGSISPYILQNGCNEILSSREANYSADNTILGLSPINITVFAKNMTDLSMPN